MSEEEALVRAAIIESSTRSKHATQLRAFDTLVRSNRSASTSRVVELFIFDYVPNHAGTGAGQPRKASGLGNALGSLLAGLEERDGWKPNVEQRRQYRQLQRGVLKLHAESTEVEKARPVLVGHLRKIKNALPSMDGTRAERERIANLWNGYAVLVLMLQGLFRKADVGRIKLENVEARQMKIGGSLVRYYLVKLQDKPRLGSVQWRHVVIVDRKDDLDSYAFLRQRKLDRSSGAMFDSPRETTRLVDQIIGWARKNVPGLAWITAHGLRVGGFQELRQVAGDDVNVRLLQGGWSSGSEGKHVQAQMASAASGYLRINSGFVQALLNVGTASSDY